MTNSLTSAWFNEFFTAHNIVIVVLSVSLLAMIVLYCITVFGLSRLILNKAKALKLIEVTYGIPPKFKYVVNENEQINHLLNENIKLTGTIQLQNDEIQILKDKQQKLSLGLIVLSLILIIVAWLSDRKRKPTNNKKLKTSRDYQ